MEAVNAGDEVPELRAIDQIVDGIFSGEELERQTPRGRSGVLGFLKRHPTFGDYLQSQGHGNA